jgi:hypothetical protein
MGCILREVARRPHNSYRATREILPLILTDTLSWSVTWKYISGMSLQVSDPSACVKGVMMAGVLLRIHLAGCISS